MKSIHISFPENKQSRPIKLLMHYYAQIVFLAELGPNTIARYRMNNKRKQTKATNETRFPQELS